MASILVMVNSLEFLVLGPLDPSRCGGQRFEIGAHSWLQCSRCTANGCDSESLPHNSQRPPARASLHALQPQHAQLFGTQCIGTLAGKSGSVLEQSFLKYCKLAYLLIRVWRIDLDTQN